MDEEQAEEAWFMMRAAIMDRGDRGVTGEDEAKRSGSGTGEATRGRQPASRDRDRTTPTPTLTLDRYALTLDFFLRLLRVLERHLAAVTVNSPLVG